MQYIADLHVHSHYSRATSPDLTPEGLYRGAKIKGIDIAGTGDFTHPKYFKELKEKLIPAPDKPGLFVLKEERQKDNFPVFMLTQEIACIYKHNDKTRRNHIVIAVPDFRTAANIIKKLEKIGNLAADGRPILGMSSQELAKVVIDANLDNLIIPGHIWTPWFSTFGSKSGYDFFQECFGAMSKFVYAIETGLSSDPLMNWRISELDNYAIISNGDAHSAKKMGREATVFELESASYFNIVKALKNSARLNKHQLPSNYIKHTIEFYPEEGKYHYDGHRACEVQFSPKQTKRAGGLCPKCRKPLTVGVMNRVDSLADRSQKKAKEYAKKYRPEYKTIVPLEEIVADAVGQNIGTKKVLNIYNQLIEKGKNEFNILLNMSKEELESITLPGISKGILRVRSGKIYINPGFDGVFGEVKVFSKEDREKIAGAQARLFG